ncbi:PRD domain-containing protein [Vallitalea maricola]|uniref:Uncharacterized protein n=1 Tax=Vallitalea maricola TaxID=3074433 RepID=A0ACB5UEW1_9FIRM|nr:hypothetical protein AN2V17_06260 [Vallitalea sp. AN17-2]
MALSLREKAIIEILINEKRPVRIYEIAEKLNVSQRTIRYDLDEIDYALKNVDECIVRKPRVGILLETQCTLEELVEKCGDNYTNMPYLNKNERYIYLGMHFLTTDDFTSSEQLATMLGVSRSAIMSDIKEISQRAVDKYNVQILAKKGYGYRVQGNEQLLRRWMSDLVYEALLLKRQGEKIHPVSEGISTLVNSYDVSDIRRAVKSSRRVDAFWLPYDEYLKVIAIIKTTFYRVEKHKYLKEDLFEGKEYIKLRTYPIAKEIVKQLAVREFPELEINFLAYELLASNMKFPDNSSKLVDPKLIDTVDEMMNFLQKHEQWSNDSITTLKKDLLFHFEVTLEKIQLNIPNNNPLLDEIKKTYFVEYVRASELLDIFKKRYNIDFTDDEIGFITMYLVKNRGKQDVRIQKNIIIVCGSGRGASRLLATRIINNISNINIHSIVAVFEIEEKTMNYENIDLVISTVPLKDIKLPWIRVSPLITDNELGLISKKLFNQKEDQEELKYVTANDKEYLNKESEFAHLIGMILIELGITLSSLEDNGLIKKDKLLQWGLTLHIVMAVPRWKLGQFNIEPDLDKAKKEQPLIFSEIKKVLGVIRDKYDLIISEDEVIPIMRYLL